MYPLGKTMQLKLNLFKESLDNYIRGKGQLKQKQLQTGNPKGTYKLGDPHPTVDGVYFECWRETGTIGESWSKEQKIRKTINQTELQTGNPRGSYKFGDPHPTIKDLFFRQYNRKEEHWCNTKTIQKDKKRKTDYIKSEKGKAYHAKYTIEYQKTDKRKAYLKVFNRSKKERLRKSRWSKSEEGRLYARIKQTERRARVREASVNLTEYEESVIKQIYAHAVRVSKKLGIPFHVDHIIPIANGGLHHPSNLQIAPASWNISKQNRHTERWLPNGM